MSEKDFCKADGTDSFTELLNFTWNAINGVDGDGLARLHDKNLDILVQGGKWKGCWSQNYFGMYGCTPLLSGALLKAHFNTLNLFFKYQGDGIRKDPGGFVGPVGALPEYVSLGGDVIVPKYKNDESSGLAHEYDFWVEGSAVSVVQTGDLLLAMRDEQKIREILPQMELTLKWILSRKDEKTGLLKVGVAGTMIERAYGATYRSKGVTDYGLPSAMIVHAVKALQIAAELEEFVGNQAKAKAYRKEAAELKGRLSMLVEDNKYLINYIDADGVRHGVRGAAKHNYFEGNANHDAVAWDMVPKETANSILDIFAEVSPTPLAVSCWEKRDDTQWRYQVNDPAYGGAGSHWNGAAWFSSNARYVIALLKHGRFNTAYGVGDILRETYKTGTFRDTRGDYGRCYFGANNPGNPDKEGVYYIDGFGTFGSLLRGLFEVKFNASSVELYPHLPSEISEYKQQVPYRWGEKCIYPEVIGNGSTIISANVNGKNIPLTGNGVAIDYDELPIEAHVAFTRE